MNNITKIGKVSIIDYEYVIKEEKDLSSLYTYLSNRSFNNFLNPLEYKDNRAKYEYKEDITIDNNQKALDLIETVSSLHNKTAFLKEDDNNKKIFDRTRGYIKYLQDKYYNYLTSLELIEFPGNNEQIIMNNYSKIKYCLDFCDKEIVKWYKKVKDEKTVRVAQIHGKLKLEHLIRSDDNYLISWDNSTIDTPIKDIIIFYKNEWDTINFKEVLDEYIKKTDISSAEKELLFVYLSIPIDDLKDASKFIRYIYKTEELIRPYYSVEKIEK